MEQTRKTVVTRKVERCSLCPLHNDKFPTQCFHPDLWDIDNNIVKDVNIRPKDCPLKQTDIKYTT